jgi:uncharacterized protein YcnI
MNHRRKLTLMVAGAGLLVGSLASGASAHVTVDTAGEAEPGDFAHIRFSVPNESDTARTTSVAVQFPTDSPIAFVSVKPLPGWTAVTKTRHLDQPIDAEGEQIADVVDTITWTAAAGGGFGPGEFEDFEVSAGPMPATSLEFPTVQTKTNPDGTTEEVRWNEPTPAGGEEPEHPLPVLALTGPAADASDGDASDGDAAPSAAPKADEAAAAVSDSDDSSDSDGLAVAAIVVAALAILTAGVALLRGRKT